MSIESTIFRFIFYFKCEKPLIQTSNHTFGNNVKSKLPFDSIITSARSFFTLKDFDGDIYIDRINWILILNFILFSFVFQLNLFIFTCSCSFVGAFVTSKSELLMFLYVLYYFFILRILLYIYFSLSRIKFNYNRDLL